MTQKLKSYVQGRWFEGVGEGTPVRDPTSEEVLATVSTEGLDFEAALTMARAEGLSAIRSVGFAQRAGWLTALASALHAHRDELLELSTRSGGNTRSDAKFDVDGATQTMAFYAKLGESLGSTNFLLDGESESLTRSPRYIGQHVRVPRDGVAVHINAFNFPAWGMGEKLAVSLLAGMPTIVKPATSTLPLAVRMMEIMVDADVLPHGVLSLVAGSCGDLVDRLDHQDVLAFTGSALTGNVLRSRPNIIASTVRVNVEADSLNAAVLGPDVEPSSDTFDLFVREVTRDMTQKSGQKCTAIRRVLVPAQIVDAVIAALKEEILRVRVGNPALKDVRMGPLATESQLKDVREGIQRLTAVASFVHGDGGRGDLVGVEPDRGYFLAPCLLVVTDPDTAHIVHDLEVFGPVTTIVPYDGSSARASSLIRRGRGGLVSSIYSDDREFIQGVVLGVASHHGRLTIGSARVAEHSPGPGTVLPSMIHGGPGRAGGGEELGGLRGLNFYLQRTAVQGEKPLLQRIFGS